MFEVISLSADPVIKEPGEEEEDKRGGEQKDLPAECDLLTIIFWSLKL